VSQQFALVKLHLGCFSVEFPTQNVITHYASSVGILEVDKLLEQDGWKVLKIFEHSDCFLYTRTVP
jgi:hypothetical protein